MKLPPHFLRVGDLPLIAEYRGAGYYGQVRQLGEAIDHTLGNSITEVFRFGIVAHIGEGQDSNRLNACRSGRLEDSVTQATDVQSDKEQGHGQHTARPHKMRPVPSKHLGTQL